MRFGGTLSIPVAILESILETTARSFRQHGFHGVVPLGDHGGYQKNEVPAAANVNKEWAADERHRALALTVYYEASQGSYIQALRGKGHSDAEIGTHAGRGCTSLMLAIDGSLGQVSAALRTHRFKPYKKL